MKQTSLFDVNAIKQALDGGVAHRIAALHLLEETASTNEYLLSESTVDANGGNARFHACLAETQTAGRGRRGSKVWCSPRNGNLYLSVMRVGPVCPVGSGAPPRSAWLALTAAGEVVSALTAVCGPGDFGVKWPNDVYCRGAKLGGILVESKGERCVVGLGLNVHPPANGETEFAWAALDEVCGETPDRTCLAAAMIVAVIRAFDRVGCDSAEALRRRWRRYDLLSGRKVTVLTDDTALSGVARGVDEHGGLRVEHDGRRGLRVYYSNEVSVRW